MIGYDDAEVGRVTITVTEVGNMAVFRPSMTEFKKLAEMERLPSLLSKSLISWTKDRPQYKVTQVLGVVEDGYTVTIHVWFDRLDEI